MYRKVQCGLQNVHSDLGNVQSDFLYYFFSEKHNKRLVYIQYTIQCYAKTQHRPVNINKTELGPAKAENSKHFHICS